MKIPAKDSEVFIEKFSNKVGFHTEKFICHVAMTSLTALCCQETPITTSQTDLVPPQTNTSFIQRECREEWSMGTNDIF